ncbi:MAG: ATP-binding cassette domain-containing protein [Proteobacteria bacterium]|nr:ATP-binding cassette domain-containing protein [Pseudomonadota bacterium]
MTERSPVDNLPPWRRLRRLLGYAKPYRGRLYVALAALLVTVAGGLVVPWFLGSLLGTAFDESLRDAAALDRTTLALLVLFALQSLFVFIRHYLMSWVGERVVADLRMQIQCHLLTLTQSYFHANRTGELLSRQSDDVTRLQRIIGQDLSLALRNLLSLLGGVSMLFYVSPTLTIRVLAVVPLLVVAASLWGRVIRRLARQAQDELANASGQLQESLSVVETVQAFTREAYESQRYGSALEAAFLLFAKQIKARSWFMSVSSFIGFGAVAGIFWLGGHMVMNRAIDAADLGRFVLYTVSVAGSVGALAGVVGSYNQALGATARLFEILDSQPEIRDRPGANRLASPVGRIAFQGVHFAYGDRDTKVISNLNLEIEPGEVCALVGASGSGKTTIGRLLLRFWDPQAGRITFDGYDLRDLTLGSLRGAMAHVSQDPALFSGPIADNIRYGRLEASDDEVRAAAVSASADGFIRRFPEGYRTIVGERGIMLSGGQRQRIAIARAILRDPKVLVLDEATSALDSDNERAVQAALERLQKGRTTLVIAHRLSTIRDADRIVVIDRGRIVEQGRHQTLMNKGGAYARLVAGQASSRRPEPRPAASGQSA